MRLCWPCGNRTTLSYSTDRFFRVVFFSVVLHFRFDWVGVLVVGSSILTGLTTISGSDNVGPLRACARINRGAFSHGRVSWTTCRRWAVVFRAESGWACGIPVLCPVRAIVQSVQPQMARQLLERLPAFKADHCMSGDALAPIHELCLGNRYRYGGSHLFLCFEYVEGCVCLLKRLLQVVRK
jgi:hypothetical protein